ncbi:MAG: lipoate--protein ligase family protein [Gemmatimonadales bacterium]
MTEARTFQGWRLMLAPARSGAENMARDTALMERARETNESVFSVYSWAVPTLTLGRNQTAKDRYDLQEIRRRGIDVVRRPTGGRALLHFHEVTYSVTAPLPDDEPLSESYERINRILLNGLERLGVHASEANAADRTPQPGDLPCFAAPVEGELVSGGGKLVGSAQVRENGALLQHGSILIEDDQPVIKELLQHAAAEMNTPQAATLHEILGRKPSIQEVARALFDGVRALEDPDATQLDEADVSDRVRGHLEHYANELWTWRR